MSWHQLTPDDKLSSFESLKKSRAAKPWKGRFHESLMEGVRFVSFDSGSSDSKATSTATAEMRSTPPTTPVPTLVLSFVVTKNLCNDFDTLHGGAQATAIDLFTSILLDLVRPVPSVTTDLHVSCVGPAPLGSTVLVVCRADKHRGSLQYSSCELVREVEEGDSKSNSNSKSKSKRTVVVAKGLHTKYVVRTRTKGYAGATPEAHRRSKL